ncbi:hypothetical protein M501DRAFT_1000270 [Patellaria atrata CBS 101060]|uniref:Protein kinase domain-containing protein n=1 Tax=Patellaria atrata CBS 101060 TaxID=1346257 RepID=A0A9P4SGE4_9PEZI|nr:hypothetical protein M501DRAFT_1000270 [Patellaria atrata CBS 101060]
MPKEFQYLRVRMKTEQYRLLDWAHVANLSENEDDLLISNASKSLLLDVLHQKEQLVNRFGKYDEKYKPLRKPLLTDDSDVYNVSNTHADDPPAYSAVKPDSPTSPDTVNSGLSRSETNLQKRFPQSETLFMRSLDLMDATRKYPKRLKWASWDKQKVEALLIKLSALNDFMMELLNNQQLEKLADKQTRTEYQIIQLNSKIDHLVQIVDAGALLALAHAASSSRRNATNPLRAFLQARNLDDSTDIKDEKSVKMPTLAQLAQFKALISATDSCTLTEDTALNLKLQHSAEEIYNSVELRRNDIHLLDNADPDDSLQETTRTEAIYHAPGSKRRQHVWIEWSTYEPLNFSGEPHPKVLERVKALTALLKENNRKDMFPAPHCVGFFRDTDPAGDDRFRFGLVFEKPASVPHSTRPSSLLELLRDPKLETPSLTDRIALMRRIAEAIERLHAVNWLHKGLRSHNILFFADSGNSSDPDVDIDFAAPLIGGFDYSRPAANEDMTEKPPENAAYDLYRHPRVHGSGAMDMAPYSPHNPAEGNRLYATSSSSSPPMSPTSGTPYYPQTNFRKTYDIYSLGVILLEIAYWQPIDRILEIPDVGSARPSVTIKVRQRLLGEARFLGHVKSFVGNKVREVIWSCLEGPTAFGIHEEKDEREEAVGAELARGFYREVVGRLQEIAV